ncbi:MAG TPA: DUF4159 domain-containing protein [Candidatus Marinimicrobia bacterium]|nr:DUF4159 domain-containing protein [Candidatus Neomarinimicrobiota bacterium]HIM26920.1 DUF4159 domain-containing protein [Candidatus Neomarinimicrobiota bacterium]
MKSFITIAAILLVTNIILGQEFSIARVNYGGGGDWYCDPSSIPNLLNYLTKNTLIKAAHGEYRIKLTAKELRGHPYLYMTGHGNVRFTDDEIIQLREYLMGGGFLHADDNYGFNTSFRREMKRVFPDRDFVELPHDHTVFHSYFDMPNGLPKIHEHDGKPPQLFALYDRDRIMVIYSYESDLGDGWEDEEVHNDPPELRAAALQMGVNIIYFALTQ